MTEIETHVQDYLDYCEYQKKLDPKTMKAYRIDFKQFLEFVQKRDSEINKAGLSSYLEQLHKDYQPRTVKRKIACVKALFNYLEFEEIIEENPFNKMKIKFKEPLVLPRVIPISIVEEFFDNVYKELDREPLTSFQQMVIQRDIAVLELLFATGARISELCCLHKENLNLVEGYVKIYGKGNKERMIQIVNPDVLLALVNYKKSSMKRSSENDYFFTNRLNKRLSEQSVRDMIKRYVEKYTIQMKITPHMWRHSVASMLMDEDVNIRYIQALLGHSTIVTTEKYTHVTLKKQKSILEVKHPRNKLMIRT